jgi:hypothetical protein
MDELKVLLEAWGEPAPPSEVARHAARAALIERKQRAGTAARRRKKTWLACGVGVSAAAAAAAVAVLAGTSLPAPARPAGHFATAQMGARQILLAAAVKVLHRQPGSYWHYKMTVRMTNEIPPATYESWIARDGRFWNPAEYPAGCPAGPAGVVLNGPGWAGFSLGPSDGSLTYERARHLPTDPAKLAAWFAAYSQDESFIADGLEALEYMVPAPPAVEAAAFRALAALPGVTSLGPVTGGVGLKITYSPAEGNWEKLVIDPATGELRSLTNYKSVTTITSAAWTNQLPRIVPLPPKTCHGTAG